jgi:arylsulfatase A-like enzyme
MLSSKYVFVFFKFIASLVLILASTSCQSEKKNSILILAFDRLPSDILTCNDDRPIENSGFAILCKESVRFTHAYTTSLQPAAAMGSVLSGEYPYIHELHRSSDRVSDHIDLVTSLARDQNMRTSFFSGSPHILKKTGLSKFFDFFDDSSPLTQKNYFKDFKLQTGDFFEWYNEDPRPFFSVIYNSELEFLKSEDTNSFEKLDEKISVFFEQMKTEKIWESTTIFLIGLNGNSRFERINESAFQNLHSENTQVVTLIKRPRSQGDEGIYWKNDTPVQLADIGKTLRRLLSAAKDVTTNTSSTFPIYNLMAILNSKDKSILQPRPLLIEAPNTWAKNLNWIQFAILQNQDLYIDYKKPVIFNTLTDRMETTNLYPQKEQAWIQPLLKLTEIKKNLNLIEASETKTQKIISTDKLISLNIRFENIWGLSNIEPK